MSRIVALLFLGLLVFALVACDGAGIPHETVTGSGHAQTQELNISGFSKITVDDRFETVITPSADSNSYFVQVTVDDNLVPYLDVTKSGDLLNVGLRHNVTYLDITCKAQVKLPSLRQLRVDGAGKASVEGFQNGEPMDFTVSGSGALTLSRVKAGKLSLDNSGAGKVAAASDLQTADLKLVLSGGSNLALAGSGKNLSLNASGGSKFDLSDFSLADASLSVSGGSQGEVKVSGKLDANISGASRVAYSGNPTLGKINVSGGATFSQE